LWIRHAFLFFFFFVLLAQRLLIAILAFRSQIGRLIAGTDHLFVGTPESSVVRSDDASEEALTPRSVTRSMREDEDDDGFLHRRRVGSKDGGSSWRETKRKLGLGKRTSKPADPFVAAPDSSPSPRSEQATNLTLADSKILFLEQKVAELEKEKTMLKEQIASLQRETKPSEDLSRIDNEDRDEISPNHPSPTIDASVQTIEPPCDEPSAETTASAPNVQSHPYQSAFPQKCCRDLLRERDRLLAIVSDTSSRMERMIETCGMLELKASRMREDYEAAREEMENMRLAMERK
jgi:hypothetical protein